MLVWPLKWYVTLLVAVIVTDELVPVSRFEPYSLPQMMRSQADMVEYNQCQAMLKNLYDLGIPGKEEEFTAYRILMLIHGRNRSGMALLSSYSHRSLTILAASADIDLNLYVGQLTPKQRASSAVQHALDVQRAMAMGNYHSLFDLYLNAPNMGAYIMDHFIERERVRALIIMSKAYVISIQLPYLPMLPLKPCSWPISPSLPFHSLHTPPHTENIS